MLKWLKSVFGLLPVLLNDTEWRVWMIFQLLKFLLEPAYNIFVFINISVIKKNVGEGISVSGKITKKLQIHVIILTTTTLDSSPTV